MNIYGDYRFGEDRSYRPIRSTGGPHSPHAAGSSTRSSQTAVIPPALVGKLKRAMLNDFRPQFPLRLMNKDFRLILETSAITWVPLPHTAAALQINVAESANETDEDFSAVIRQMEKLARSDAPIEGWRSNSPRGTLRWNGAAISCWFIRRATRPQDPPLRRGVTAGSTPDKRSPQRQP
jgi:hypothetical protein